MPENGLPGSSWVRMIRPGWVDFPQKSPTAAPLTSGHLRGAGLCPSMLQVSVSATKRVKRERGPIPFSGCQASAAPATVGQCGCMQVNRAHARIHPPLEHHVTSLGCARMPREGDAASLASPETGLLHPCAPSGRVAQRSSAGLRMMAAVLRPRAGHAPSRVQTVSPW